MTSSNIHCFSPPFRWSFCYVGSPCRHRFVNWNLWILYPGSRFAQELLLQNCVKQGHSSNTHEFRLTGMMQCEDCLDFVQSLYRCSLEVGCSGWIFLIHSRRRNCLLIVFCHGLMFLSFIALFTIYNYLIYVSLLMYFHTVLLKLYDR